MGISDKHRWLRFGLVLGAFTLGTSENIVSGVLPSVAAHYHVTLATAGLLVTLYAGTVTVLGPVVTVALARFGATRTVLGLLGVYLAASVMTALAPTFAVMAAGRVLGALGHTTILVLLVLTAMRLAPPGHEGRAVGRVAGGLAIAAVLGVPLGVFAAEHAGWRAAFAVVTVLCAMTLLVVGSTCPCGLEITRSTDLRTVWSAVRRRTVLVCVTASALGATAALTVVTYVVPLLERGSGLAGSAVAPALLLYGLGGVVGNALGGRLADALRTRSVVVTFGILTASLVLLWVAARHGWFAVAALFIVGVSYFATFTPLNTAVARDTAGIAPDAALALNSSAFNLGIAVAGVLGGVLMSMAPSGSALAPVTAVVAAVGATVAGVGLREREMSP